MSISFQTTPWTLHESAGYTKWSGVAFGNGVFCAVGYDIYDSTKNLVMTSPDGITWTDRTPPAISKTWYDLTYGNGLFVAVAYKWDPDNLVMTSPDGITWTSRVTPANNGWNSVCYGNGLYVAVSSTGTGDRVMTSPDGITWTSRVSAADYSWNSVTYGNGLFVAVGFTGGTEHCMTSPDGITWTLRTTPDNVWYAVVYGNGQFVAVALEAVAESVMTSPDGITWTGRESADSNASWRGLVYTDSFYIAQAGPGQPNRLCMTSTDAITWSLAETPGDEYFSKMAYDSSTGLVVAVAATEDSIQTNMSTTPASAALPTPDYPNEPGGALIQHIFRTPAGRVTSVAISNGPIYEPVLHFTDISQAEYDTLETFINTKVTGGKDPFIYTDWDGESYTVKYLSGLPGHQITDDQWAVDLTLLVVPTQ